jgi:hypothetical protein
MNISGEKNFSRPEKKLKKSENRFFQGDGNGTAKVGLSPIFWGR